MGFFDSTNTQDSSMSYENPQLQKYTEAYRGAAPWGFASLDPSATLAARQAGKLGYNMKIGDVRNLQAQSAQEKAQSKASDDALARIQERQKSGNFLTTQETDFINTSLDKAFESSRNIAMKDWTMGAQQLAGGRGLRMSDTSVAQPSMNALRDMELGFSSQRAQAGLDTTLKMSAQQGQFDAGLMDSLNSLQLNRWNARQGYLFGGGLSAAANLGYNTTQHTSTTQGMSGFGQVMAGFQMANAGLDLTGRVASAGTGGLSSFKPPTA